MICRWRLLNRFNTFPRGKCQATRQGRFRFLIHYGDNGMARSVTGEFGHDLTGEILNRRCERNCRCEDRKC